MLAHCAGRTQSFGCPLGYAHSLQVQFASAVTERGRVMQRKSARKYHQEITLSSNQLRTRTWQPWLHVMPRHLRQHLLTRR